MVRIRFNGILAALLCICACILGAQTGFAATRPDAPDTFPVETQIYGGGGWNHDNPGGAVGNHVPDTPGGNYSHNWEPTSNHDNGNRWRFDGNHWWYHDGNRWWWNDGKRWHRAAQELEH